MYQNREYHQRNDRTRVLTNAIGKSKQRFDSVIDSVWKGECCESTYKIENITFIALTKND